MQHPGKLLSPLRPLFREADYCRMVEEGKRYIREGDIFQVVLSNRLEAEFSGSLLDTYRILRASNPSPYMFYFSSDVAGGLTPENLPEAVRSLHPWCVDLSSGVETDGVKDREKMAAAVRAVRIQQETLTHQAALAQ